jgi:RHS repeat-associated protein
MYAHDQGLGIDRFELKIPPESAETYWSEQLPCKHENGFVGCPASEYSSKFNNLANIETGAWTLGVYAENASGIHRQVLPAPKIYVDHTPPVIGTLSGSLYEARGKGIGSGNYTLNFSATDGSVAAPQSGMDWLTVKVDGEVADQVTTPCAYPKGIPAENCYGSSGSWTFNGQKYGAGEYTITVEAGDYMANVSTESFTVNVNEAGYEPVGPGVVNLETGNFRLNATDVSVGAGAANLSVSRTYESRPTARSAAGPLGAQWALSLPASSTEEEWQSLTVLPEGVELTAAHGGAVTFTAKEGGYTSPAGFQTEILTKVSTTEYKLSDVQGDYTLFTQPATGSAFYPSSVVQASAAGGLNQVKYTFAKSAEGFIEPTEVLGPEPTPEACKTSLVKGCRALTFQYATSTTATGGNRTEWGNYKGLLEDVKLTAWEPAKGEMTTITVARYVYDKSKRLRAEWDSQITPSLKTVYGYNGENILTALTPPGEETWALTYGTITGDSNTGRLLKARRAPASTPLWNGIAPSETEAPTVTGTPAVGTTLGVSSGKWSNEPAAFSYQWEDCNSSGGNCTPIAGATNPNYKVTSTDEEWSVYAFVTAINAGNATTVSVDGGAAGETATEYPLPAKSEPYEIAQGSEGEMWYTNIGTFKVGKITSSGTKTEYALGGKQEPSDITPGPGGHTWFDIGAGERGSPELDYVNEAGTIVRYPQKYKPLGITSGPEGDLWGAVPGVNQIDKYGATGELLASYPAANEAGVSFIAEGGEGNLWFTESQLNKIGKITPAGVITEYPLPAKSEPWGITAGSEGDMWFTDAGTSKIEKITSTGTRTEYALPEGSEPVGITVGADDNYWFSEFGTSKIGKITSTGSITQYPLPVKSEPFGIAQGHGDVWYDSYGTSKIGKLPTWGTASVVEGTKYSPEPGTTIEYNVPASGTGAPHALGSKEVEEWAQTDKPEAGTAIFAPDEPQSWPATGYKRATIFYLDSANHTVNVATPTGGISTNEYNQGTNTVERALTPDDREAALKETGKTATVAAKLSTDWIYNSSGTQLLEAIGPEHTVKEDNGGTVSARKVMTYEYDKSEPAGGPYNLVTSSTEGLRVGSGAIEDTRTVTKSYSGQENLGWKLHEATSASTGAGTSTLTTNTTYEPATGQVEETQTAAEAGKDTHVPPAYATAFGAKGTAGGDFDVPVGVAVDASGDVWVTDTLNHRLDRLTASGTFIEAIGWGVSNGEAKLETCTSSCKAGTAGSGNGQLSYPAGIAISGGDVYVADYENNRVTVFGEKGEWIRSIGSKGTGFGNLEGPFYVGVSAGGTIWVSELGNNRLSEFSASGTPIETVGWGVSNSELKAEICTSSCKAGFKGTGNGELDWPAGIAFSGGKMYVAEDASNRVQEFSETGEYAASYGSEGTGAGQFYGAEGIVRNPLNGDLLVTDYGNNRVKELTASLNSGQNPVYQFGDKGTGHNQLSGPEGIAVNSSGDIYVVDDSNNRVEEFKPTINGNEAAHGTQTIYYTAGVNSHEKSCGEHAEWAGLPCQAQHAAQPATGLPNLTTTTYTYNLWQEPVTITDTSGSSKRTTTVTYEAAGRKTASAITATTGTALPSVTYKYSETTGALEEQSNSNEEHIKMVANTLGQLTSYTDAEGVASTYEYEKEKDYRLLKSSDGKGTQTVAYNATTGLIEKLEDSAAGTFTATDDAEGNLISEGYPNGMTATYTHNQIGEATSLVYAKGKDTIYSDSVTPSIHGQWLAQSSSLSSDTYAFNGMGWLTEAQETPTGKGCTARLYGLDEDGNRASETIRKSETSTCPTEGGSTQTWNFDTADQLEGTGITYDPWGDITELPAEDAGGSAVHSTFYADSQLATIEQNGQKITYKLDPDDRAAKTTTASATTTVNYSAPGNGPSWTAEGSNWTRLIRDIRGTLAGLETNGKTTILQVANLHGDIIGQLEDNPSEAEPKLSSPTEATEYGVPATSKPEPFSWLGTDSLRTELPTGIIDMGARAYIPQLGRFEQPDPQPGGSLNSYTYTGDNPITEADPSGELGGTITVNENAVAEGEGTNLPGGVGTAPGAIIPQPADKQLIEEFYANPPWDAAAAYEEAEEGGGAESGFTAKAAMINRGGSKGSCDCSINIDRTGSHSFWDGVTGHAEKIVGAAAFVVGGVVAGAVAAVGGSLCLAGGEYTDLLAVLADPCAHIIVFGGTFATGQFIAAGKLLSET